MSRASQAAHFARISGLKLTFRANSQQLVAALGGNFVRQLQPKTPVETPVKTPAKNPRASHAEGRVKRVGAARGGHWKIRGNLK